MALTGVLQRRDKKSVIIQNPPRVGEIVYALDTEEYGSLQNGNIIWRKFDDIVKSVAGKTGIVVLDKNDVGLGNADNTSDLNKPISTATQSALTTHENTINAHHVTAELLNLGNVDNTSDLNKPVSTATQTAINDAKKSITVVNNALNLDGKPASEYALVSDYFTKITTETLLNKKANVSDSYTKTEEDNLLSAKADQSNFTIVKQKVLTLETSDSTKTSKTYVDNELALKTNQTDFVNLSKTVQTNKSDISTNTTDIATNKNNIDVLTLQKSDKSYVDTQDTNLQTQITTNTTDIKNLTIGGTTKSYVDTQDTKLQTQITNLNTNKADKTYVDAQDSTINNKISSNVTNLQTQITANNNDISKLNVNKVNKAYVDSVISGLDAKEAVLVASTANIDLSKGGLLTIDGKALVGGDRVLVKNQTNAPDNGIYVVSSGTWTRSTDADNKSGSEVRNGMYCFVTDGTVNANTGWILSAAGAVTLGTTALIFNKFSNTILSADDILSKLKTVDGSGSGLDADLLDGKDSTYLLDRANQSGTQTASTISDFSTSVSSNTDVTANTAHRNNITGNPHKITKAEVGLGNVDNTADINKPISTAQDTRFAAVEKTANAAAPQVTTYTKAEVDAKDKALLDSALAFVVALG